MLSYIFDIVCSSRLLSFLDHILAMLSYSCNEALLFLWESSHCILEVVTYRIMSRMFDNYLWMS